MHKTPRAEKTLAAAGQKKPTRVTTSPYHPQIYSSQVNSKSTKGVGTSTLPRPAIGFFQKTTGPTILPSKLKTSRDPPFSSPPDFLLATQRAKDQAAAEILSYLAATPKSFTKLPFNMSGANYDFDSPINSNRMGIGTIRPNTVAGGIRRKSTPPQTVRRSTAVSGKRREEPPPPVKEFMAVYGTKNAYAKPYYKTPPNTAVESPKTSESKIRKNLRSARSNENFLKDEGKNESVSSERLLGKVKSSKSGTNDLDQDTETKTVFAARTLHRTSSLQIVTPQLRNPKQKEGKKLTKTRMTINSAAASKGKPDLNNNYSPPAEAKKSEKSLVVENLTAKAIRSAISALALQEAQRIKPGKAEKSSSTDAAKEGSKVKRAGAKGRKKTVKVKHQAKAASLSASKEQFADFQNKKIDEQFLHVYERQEKLESEVRRLIDGLEIEQAIRGSATHGLSSSPCCCSAEIRGNLKNLIQKQKQLIRLQIDLRKRYGVSPFTLEKKPDVEMPILNGYNIHFDMFAPYAREMNGKMVYYCENCQISSETELLFRLHLESPQHVVKAYKDIHNGLPVYQCEGCDTDLRGTTKYMSHVTSDAHSPTPSRVSIRKSKSYQAVISSSADDFPKV